MSGFHFAVPTNSFEKIGFAISFSSRSCYGRYYVKLEKQEGPSSCGSKICSLSFVVVQLVSYIKDLLPPLLFAIAVDVISENAREGLMNEVLYANDLVLMSESVRI